MKQKILGILLISIFSLSVFSANAVPKLTYEEFMKTYQPKIDKVNTEKMNPRKQIEFGMYMLDVICFDGKIQVLKFSDPSLVVCVSPETAQRLVKQNWGMTKNENMFASDSHGRECGNSFVIFYDETKPTNHQVVYSIRNAIKEISEYLLWQPIKIEEHDERKTIIAGLGGNFNSVEFEIISNSLKQIDGIYQVGQTPGACI